MVKLSKRLMAVAGMVYEGNYVVDVGTDHGYLPIWLVEKKRCPRALALDINAGPLEHAAKNILEQDLKDRIGTVLSDGLKAYEIPAEVANGSFSSSLVIAGMGGGLMARILEEEPKKTESFFELVLAPQSEVQKVRYFLRTSGWKIADEDFVEDEGKFYPVIRAVKRYDTTSADAGETSQEREYTLEDYYGPILLGKALPDFVRFLSKERRQYSEILDRLADGNEERWREVEQLLIRNTKAMDRCTLHRA